MARRGQSLTEPSLWDQPRTEHRAPPGPEATDQRLLVFPQGKEEMCKEEVVESESRHIDLQKEPPRAACECAGQVAWNGRDMGSHILRFPHLTWMIFIGCYCSS